MIEEQTGENFNIINQYGLKVGLILRLEEDYNKFYKRFKKGDLVSIKHIHKIYGWIVFNESFILPQIPKDIMELCEVATKENILESLK